MNAKFIAYDNQFNKTVWKTALLEYKMKWENEPKFKRNVLLFTCFTILIVVNLFEQILSDKVLKDFFSSLIPNSTVLQETYCKALGYKRPCDN